MNVAQLANSEKKAILFAFSKKVVFDTEPQTAPVIRRASSPRIARAIKSAQQSDTRGEVRVRG